MASQSNIQWTDATWNPSTGCTKVSPGCQNCYAEQMAGRLRRMGQPKYAAGFAYAEHLSAVGLPLGWRKPRRIFVNSMSDTFHERADWDFILGCFDVMLRADWHTYQILTKRPYRAATFSRMFCERFGHSIPRHIWMGTSVESQNYLDRLNELRRVRCQTRFVSFEPLLGSIRPDLSGIDWAIVGGESGPGCRPVRKEWVRDLIAECRRQNVPVFFKQWAAARQMPEGGWSTAQSTASIRRGHRQSASSRIAPAT